MDVEKLLLQCERLVAKLPRLKIDYKFGIERLVAIAHLEVQVGPPAPAGRTTESDHLSALHVVVHSNVDSRQMGVPRLQSVFVAYDDQIAKTSGIILRITHLTVESRIDRLSDFQWNIHSIVVSPSTGSVFREDVPDDRRMEIGQLLNQIQLGNLWQILVGNALVGKHL